jgi:3-deoxy-D-manno-octulosonic-acid transferase
VLALANEFYRLISQLMNRHLYSILLYVITPLLLIYLGLRAFKSPDYRGRWAERFGLTRLTSTHVLVHSVSMGETLAAIPLIKRLMQANPQWRFTVTTTSPTGSKEVIKAFGDKVQHCYLPFDLAWCVQRFIKQVQPKLLIVMETELWPNLLYFANQSHCKTLLLNARLSAKSAEKYQKYLTLSRPMLQSLDALGVQTQAEADRFIALGVEPKRVTVCGSLKFDLLIDEAKRAQARSLRQQWNRVNSPIWVAGSVHPGEFEAVLAAHQGVLKRFPDALLIMAPRHPEQFNAAAQAVIKTGLNLARRSEQDGVKAQTQVLLADTMGELLMLYGTGDHAFVGGTLIENGGHNPLEPAAMGLSVCVGPHHWNFAEIARLLKYGGGLEVVDSEMALSARLIALFDNPELAKDVADSALAVVERNRGALEKQLTVVEPNSRLVP